MQCRHGHDARACCGYGSCQLRDAGNSFGRRWWHTWHPMPIGQAAEPEQCSWCCNIQWATGCCTQGVRRCLEQCRWLVAGMCACRRARCANACRWHAASFVPALFQWTLPLRARHQPCRRLDRHAAGGAAAGDGAPPRRRWQTRVFAASTRASQRRWPQWRCSTRCCLRRGARWRRCLSTQTVRAAAPRPIPRREPCGNPRAGPPQAHWSARHTASNDRLTPRYCGACCILRRCCHAVGHARTSLPSRQPAHAARRADCSGGRKLRCQHCGHTHRAAQVPAAGAGLRSNSAPATHRRWPQPCAAHDLHGAPRCAVCWPLALLGQRPCVSAGS